MKIAVIANDLLKEEMLSNGIVDDGQVEWMEEIKLAEGTACYIDLLYTSTPERNGFLKNLLPAIVIINEVITTLDTLPENFIRINGWPGFLKRNIVEATARNTEMKNDVEKIFRCFNKKIEWLPDIAGFIAARVISMIINEAYFALDEKVSTKEEIDTAMKLGTNYPYGPFEWGEKIGLEKIYTLLIELAKTNARYEPALLLKKEVAI